MRLGFSLCQAELEFLQKRRVVVAEALKQVLQLEEDLQADEVGEQRSSQSQACPSNTVPASCPLQSLPCPRAASALPFLVALTAEVPGAQVRAVLDVIQLCFRKGQEGQSREKGRSPSCCSPCANRSI